MAKNVLTDIEHAAQNAFNSIQHTGNNAGAAISQALTNTAQLAGSGVNSAGRIVGPLADAFGSDPVEFVLSFARQTRGRLRELCLRVQKRTGVLDYTFNTPQGKRKVTAKPPANATAAQLALTLVLITLDSPATAIEESGRMAHGLPVKAGGGRGLTGGEENFTVFPIALHPTERGLFGIDDAILITTVLPIIASIALSVLPALIAAAGAVIAAVTGGGDDAKKQQAAQQAQQAQQQTQTMMTVAVVGGVLLVTAIGIFLVMHKKKRVAA